MSKKFSEPENINQSLFDGDTIKWYHYLIHLGYYIPYWLRFFFSRPFKKPKKDLNILDQVGSLLSIETTAENLDKCRQLTGLHRVVENTKARRRLERWSLRVIVCYLVIVLGIVVLTYCPVSYAEQTTQITNAKETPTTSVQRTLDNSKEDKGFLKIPEAVMITILSTTTVNIIGLGLIVLRGHFLFNDQMKDQEVEKEK